MQKVFIVFLKAICFAEMLQQSSEVDIPLQNTINARLRYALKWKGYLMKCSLKFSVNANIFVQQKKK